MSKLQAKRNFTIIFPQTDDADANIYASDLANCLKDQNVSYEELSAEPVRSNRQSQDFGTSLALILGTAATTAVAKGIQVWLKGHTGASMEIMTEQGHVILRNVESKSLAEIAKAFAEAMKL